MKTNKMPNEVIILENVNLIDYYNKMIVGLDPIFKQMTESNRTAICPFHKDTDPSLHAWYKRGTNGETTKIFHCFGCNYGGDVVKTHQKLMGQYHRVTLNKKEAIIDLSQIFQIPLREDGFNEDFKDIYEEALYRLTNPQRIQVTNPLESIAHFDKMNRQILQDKHMTYDQKVKSLAELDKLYALILQNA